MTPSGRQRVPAIVWVLVIVILVMLPLRILSFGYLPPDDALRYAAKAVSGKSWAEIVVMRPDVKMDHNPGWNWILKSIHQFAHWDTWAIVAFSVVIMFLVFALAPLPWLKRPEIWLASLTLMVLAFPYFADRAFVGRPLFLSMGVTLILLSLWTRPQSESISRSTWALSISLLALAAWVHGSWYLLILLPVSFLLAGQWRKALQLSFCWVAGTLLGALLTGHPFEFLKQSALVPLLALGKNAPLNSLVGEFQPMTGHYPAAIIVVAILVWRHLMNRPIVAVLHDPIFWLAVLGFALGFRVFRFWLDWGIPALALWLAGQLQELLESRIARDSWLRVAVTCALGFILFSFVASDRDGRWSQFGKWESLDARRPEHAGWVPDNGGILYCVNLSVFYETFFQNPHGNWRYILGFEPAFMRPEDLAVYQELWRTLNAVKACAPWVQKMTPADRLVLLGGPQPQPAMPELEWYYAAENTWVGRLPRGTTPANHSPEIKNSL
jgi:hypothetical protein